MVVKVFLGVPPHTADLLHLPVQRHIPAVWNTDTPSDMEWDPKTRPPLTKSVGRVPVIWV